MQSEKYWLSWFKGLSELFIKSRVHKVLLLAERDRMDKDLTVAQMQGKFKLVVFSDEVGHQMMEDSPFETA